MSKILRGLALCVVMTAASATHASVVISFEALASGTVVSHQYQAQGVLFDGSLIVSSGSTSTNPVTGDNSVYFAHPTDLTDQSAQVEICFVLPGTSTPAVTDLVQWTPTDASNVNTTFIMEAYDAQGQFITSASRGVTSTGLYTPQEDPPVSISAPAIAKVIFRGNTTPGANFVIEGDDLMFNTPTPEPTSLALAALGGLVLLRRRRRTRTRGGPAGCA